MIRHVVLFRWKEGTTPAAIAALEAGLAGLPAVVPAIRRYEFGQDLHLGEGRFDFAVVADFADVHGYETYSAHPDHLALIDELVRPIVDGAVRVQYSID